LLARVEALGAALRPTPVVRLAHPRLRLFAHNPIVLNISLRDLGTDAILGSYNVVDDIEHVLNADTSPHLTEQRVGHRALIHATIPQLLAGERRPGTDRPVVVSPFGLGVLDLAVGQ
jgi:N-[(2S)-2-amino-2-carboxyethyl]-L-glutamate dehydrogenase